MEFRNGILNGVSRAADGTISIRKDGYEYIVSEYPKEKHIEIPSPLDESQILKCSVCDCNIIQSAVAEHMTLQHSIHKCSKCNKTFISKHLLRNHVRQAHMKDCPVCGLLVRKSFYAAHVAEHSAAKLYKCPVENCNQSFKNPSLLRQHASVHRDTGKFQSNQCPFCKLVMGNLEAHIATHLRPFPCDMCSVSYSSEDKLKAHKAQKHQPKYQCNICKKVYKTHGALSKHKRSIHSNIVHPCPACKATYNRRDNMLAHVRRAHPNSPLIKSLKKR